MAERITRLTYPVDIIDPDPAPKLPNVEDQERIKKQIYFANGRWIPAAGPTTLTENDFTDVCNVRQAGNFFEGVMGYEKLHTSCLPISYIKARAAIQLHTPYSTKSRIIGEFWESNLVSAKLYENIVSIGASASFVNSPLWGSATLSVGRLALWPDIQAMYCNGQYNLIYGGDQNRCAAFINYLANNPSVEYDYTSPVGNKLYDVQNVAVLMTAGGGFDVYASYLAHFNGTVVESVGLLSTNYSNLFNTATPGINDLNSTWNVAYGMGGYIKYDMPQAAFDLNGGVWTIDFRFQVIAVSSQCFINLYTDANNYLLLALTSTGAIEFKLYTSSATVIDLVSSSGVVTAGVKYHLQVVEDTGHIYYVFLNGKIIASGTAASDPPTYASPGAANIGYAAHGTGGYLNGYMWELRVSKGIARNTTAFTPPGAPYTSAVVCDVSVGSLKKPAGLMLEFLSANTGLASTSLASTAVAVWGSTWAPVSALVDNTSTSYTFQKDGTILFSDTTSWAQPKYLHNRLMYWTRLTVTGIDSHVTVKNCTVITKAQPLTDLWNGEFLPIGVFLIYRNGAYEDYTDDMNDDSKTTYASVGVFMTSQFVLLGSPVPAMGFMIDMVQSLYNKSSTASIAAIQYCNGLAPANWSDVANIADDTVGNKNALNQGGAITFDPVPTQSLFKARFNNEQMYFYKLYFSGSMSGSAGIWRTRIIPAPNQVLPYRFPFSYKNRPMLCGLDLTNEGGRVDYGQTDTYAFWNGSDSSFGVDNDSLFFGGNEPLTAACEVFNKVGSTLYHIAVFTKAHETYILNGSKPDDFQIMTLSKSIGCPSPMSMDAIEIGYAVGDKIDSVRCIAIWGSHLGPVIFDTTNLTPIWDDIFNYFDPDSAECINRACLDKVVGWVDPLSLDYNYCFPSGSGQTTNNVWLFYDLSHKKWFRRLAPQTPQSVVRVTAEDGTQYAYGFFDDGIMRRLDWGKMYDATPMERYVVTADIMPAGDMWTMTALRRLKVITGVNGEDKWMSVAWVGSGASVASATHVASINLSTSATFVKDTTSQNLEAWSHKLKFALTGNVTNKGLKLVAWGAEFVPTKPDHK